LGWGLGIVESTSDYQRFDITRHCFCTRNTKYGKC
jgi:hypothetical protein